MKFASRSFRKLLCILPLLSSLCIAQSGFGGKAGMGGRAGFGGGGSGGSTPSFVQEKDNVGTFAGTTVAVTFGTMLVASSQVTCAVGWSGSATFTSLQDGTGANFTQVDTNITSGTVTTYRLTSSTGGSSASTITLTLSGTVSSNPILICYNTSASSTLDVHAVQSQSFPGSGTNAITSGSVTTTASDVCMGFTIDNGGAPDNFTVGTNVAWTLDQNPGHVYYSAEHFVQSGPGAIAADFNSTNGGSIIVETAVVCSKGP